MARYVIVIFLLAFVPTRALADTLKSEQDAKKLSEEIIALFSKDLEGAINLMEPYTVIQGAELKTSLLKSKELRDQYINRYGKSIGYEFIGERKAGDSILKLVYIEKTEKHVFPWTFFFYRASTGWALNSFSWDDQVDSAFRL